MLKVCFLLTAVNDQLSNPCTTGSPCRALLLDHHYTKKSTGKDTQQAEHNLCNEVYINIEHDQKSVSYMFISFAFLAH